MCGAAMAIAWTAVWVLQPEYDGHSVDVANVVLSALVVLIVGSLAFGLGNKRHAAAADR
jgi:hypothetical protein